MTRAVGWPRSAAFMAGLTAVIGLAVFLPIVQIGLSHFDEGFISTGAMLIRRGWLPIRDFFVIYGPGQYYVSAALFEVFGEDLFVQRVAHALLLSAMGGGVAVLACRLGASVRGVVWVGLTFVALTAVFMPNPGYAAVPSAAMLLLSCPLLVDGLLMQHRWRLVAASLLIGIAGLLRWDFAVFGLVVASATALVVWRGRPNWAAWAMLVWPAVLLLLCLFLPFVLLGGWERWLNEVPLFHLLEFAHWRETPALRPAVWSLLKAIGASSVFEVSKAACLLWALVIPFFLSLTTLCVSVPRLLRDMERARSDVLALALALLTLALLNQVRVRSGLPQGWPALCVALPLGPYLWVFAKPLLPRAALVAVAGLSLCAPAVSLADRVCRAALETVPMPLAKASHLRVPANAQPGFERYAALVQTIGTHVPRDARIFSGVQDTSRLFVNDAALYFLVDRLPATRWVEMEPGLTNSPQQQVAVVEELKRFHPPWIVLYNKLSGERNRTSVSNGRSPLDEFVRERYVQKMESGPHQVLEWR